MKTFIEYLICEGTKNSDKSKLRHLFYSVLKNTKINAKKSEKAINEIFRADLGKTEQEARSFLQPLCDKIGIKLGDYSIFGRPQASGTYQSFEITYNGINYYITNTETGKGLLHNKDLVPIKILKNISSEFKSFEQLASNIKINDVKYELIQNVLDDLVDTIRQFNVVEENGFFKSSDFSQSISDRTKPLNGKIIIQNSKKLESSLHTIANVDILNIAKDFGEIIQPLIFLKKYNDSVIVTFPTAANEKMVDYYINGNQFSAKSGAGGAPSGANIFEKALDDMKKFPDKFTSEEAKFIEEFKNVYFTNIFLSQLYIIKTFLLPTNEKLASILNKIGINEWNTYSDLAKTLDNIQDKKEFFTNLFNLINYHPENFKTGTPSYDPDSVSKNWNKYNDRLKYGILFYPLYILSIKKINEKYQDLLSSIISKTTDIIQCYFDIKQHVLVLKLYEAQKNKWKFTAGGISTANINNAKLSIKMLK